MSSAQWAGLTDDPETAEACSHLRKMKRDGHLFSHCVIVNPPLEAILDGFWGQQAHEARVAYKDGPTPKIDSLELTDLR